MDLTNATNVYIKECINLSDNNKYYYTTNNYICLKNKSISFTKNDKQLYKYKFDNIISKVFEFTHNNSLILILNESINQNIYNNHFIIINTSSNNISHYNYIINYKNNDDNIMNKCFLQLFEVNGDIILLVSDIIQNNNEFKYNNVRNHTFDSNFKLKKLN